MVKVWAEKEMRNYRRLHAASIPCPKPILLKSHVLVMQFLGENGWPSPRLKDAQLSEKRFREAYVQTVTIMRRMYQRCRLVHGDLSEYNLLWHKNEVHVIDVSQSVETDHPSALDFLRKDVANVNDFFRKIGNLNVMTTRQLFEFVTSTLFDDTLEAESEALDEIMEFVDANALRRSGETLQQQKVEKQQEDVDEAVFMSQFLPRSLNQMAEYEIGRIEDGDVEETYAMAVAALTGNKKVVDAMVKKQQLAQQQQQQQKSTFEGEELNLVEGFDNGDGAGDGGSEQRGDCIDEAFTTENDVIGHDNLLLSSELDSQDDACEDEGRYNNGEDEDDNNDGHYDDEGRFIKRILTSEEIALAKEAKKAAMKAHKKSVKEAQSEKRQNKIKKKDKKRAIKKTKGNKKK